MEFELTESQHSKNPSLPLTISACYKAQGNLEKSLEAWRILRAAVSGKELDSNIVSKFEEELKAFMKGSETHALTGPPRQVGRTEGWMEVSKNSQPFANKKSKWKAVPQKNKLLELTRRNADLGFDENSSPENNLEPGSASSENHQEPDHPFEPPTKREQSVPVADVVAVSAHVTKKTIASSLPQELDGYRQEEKVRIQVKAALKMLSESARTIIQMGEILARPGADVLEPIFRYALDQQEDERLTAVEMITVLHEFISAAEASGALASHATSSVCDGPTSSAAHQQPVLQSLLQESLEPVSDSPVVADTSLVLEGLAPSSSYSEKGFLDIQNKVLTDMATHFDLKFTNKPLWLILRHKGMVEFPSELALKTVRLLFKSDHAILSKTDFLGNRAAYEPNPGHVYCDAGNGIMAKYFDAHVVELRKKIRIWAT
jgi:hypothetical protein